MVSHPTWVRGLKLLMYHNISTYCTSHPTWVRGLKLRLSRVMLHLLMSHPTWVRGLKRKSNKLSIKSNLVAPYVGAWIETNARGVDLDNRLSRTLRGCVD